MYLLSSSLFLSLSRATEEDKLQQENSYLKLFHEESMSWIISTQPQKTELHTAHIFISFRYSVLIC